MHRKTVNTVCARCPNGVGVISHHHNPVLVIKLSRRIQRLDETYESIQVRRSDVLVPVKGHKQHEFPAIGSHSSSDGIHHLSVIPSCDAIGIGYKRYQIDERWTFS